MTDRQSSQPPITDLRSRTPDHRPPIKVLVVDDSPVACELISHIINSDPGMRVTDVVHSGKEAIASIRSNKPDIVTMDITMPHMNGFEATRIIMETDPLPIVIVTGRPDIDEVEMSFEAIEAGALAAMQKPHGIGHPAHESDRKGLLTTLRLMSEIKVVKRWGGLTEKKSPSRKYDFQEFAALPDEIKVAAMGASTGGPPVIETILSQLSKDFSAPLLIVQHMAHGFTQGFVEWLNQKSSLPVHVAPQYGEMHPGHVYVAPDKVQMKVDRTGHILCTDDGPENGLRPSVSYLFRSVAEVFGRQSIGILLTGMGKDGAEELKTMKEKGALTIAQNKDSSVVFGMPGEAEKIKAATFSLPPDNIASLLNSMGMTRRRRH